jgi:hypothetical protein
MIKFQVSRRRPDRGPGPAPLPTDSDLVRAELNAAAANSLRLSGPASDRRKHQRDFEVNRPGPSSLRLDSESGS